MSARATKRRRKTNRVLLIERLTTSFDERVGPERPQKRDGTPKPWETSHLQSMAAHFARELDALASGAGECQRHLDLVDGACPRCERLWPDDATKDAAEVGRRGGRVSA